MNDPMSTLADLRPVTTVDRQWPAADREAALRRILATAAPRPARRRRVLLTAALTAGLVASGTGIAAAAGVLPERLTASLSFWNTETAGVIDAQSARRVAQTPGPDGTVLSVWSATGPDGTTCIAPMYEAPGPLDRPAPAGFDLAGGQCATPDPAEPFGNSGGSSDGRGNHTMWTSTGPAVRAELILPDGGRREVLRWESFFFYWYFASRAVAAPTLVAYDDRGEVVGRHPLPRLGR